MSPAGGPETPCVVDWQAAGRRRRQLDAELQRIILALPRLGVLRAILFGSLARGDIGAQSDLDLILVVETRERFLERCASFHRALEPAVGMDILVYTPDEFEAMRDGRFLRQALADGKVVYEA